MATVTIQPVRTTVRLNRYRILENFGMAGGGAVLVCVALTVCSVGTAEGVEPLGAASDAPAEKTYQVKLVLA